METRTEAWFVLERDTTESTTKRAKHWNEGKSRKKSSRKKLARDLWENEKHRNELARWYAWMLCESSNWRSKCVFSFLNWVPFMVLCPLLFLSVSHRSSPRLCATEWVSWSVALMRSKTTVYHWTKITSCCWLLSCYFYCCWLFVSLLVCYVHC